MELTEVVQTVTAECDRWGIFSTEKVSLKFGTFHPTILASTGPIPKLFDNGVKGFTYEVEFHVEHWGAKSHWDLDTEAGVFFNRKSLVDTVRHELAHVLHIDQCLPMIRKTAAEWSGVDYDIMALIGGYRRSMKYANSAHGPEWKKMAKLLNAYPSAHSIY